MDGEGMGITRDFLEQFYGDTVSEDARCALWFRESKRHSWCSSLDQAEKVAQDNAGRDTYFTMALYPKGCSSRKQDKASCLFGVWLDIDVGKPQSAKNYFPSMEEAMDWIHKTLTNHWSIIVHSGGGIHLYLLFDEPFWIEDELDRSQARRVAKAFQHYANNNCPYDIDMTFDISRIMRLPGSTHTGTGEQCHVIDVCERSVSITELLEELPSVRLSETSHVADADEDVDIGDLKARIQLIRDVDRTFDQTWRRSRRFKDNSPSSYCMSLANQLVVAGLTDGEIMAAIDMWRQGQTDAATKPRSWLRSTVAKARADGDAKQKEMKFDQTISETPNLDDEGKREAVTMLFGMPFKRMVKRVVPEHKGRKERSSYVLEFVDGRTIVLDGVNQLLNQQYMREMMVEEMQVVMKRLKGPQYDAVITVLIGLMEIEEGDLEGNLAFMVEQQLKAFVAQKHEACEIQEIITEYKPNELYKDEDGALYFSWPTFKLRLDNNRLQVPNKELATILRSLGSDSKQFNDKRRTRLWSVPEELR
jgi:hypothetical protein